MDKGMIETSRLIIRPLVRTDAGTEYAEWLNDPEVNRYLEARFEHHSCESIAETIDGWNADSSVHPFAIINRSTGELIGTIKLGPVDQRHQTAEVALMIGCKDHWGTGLGSEAIGGVARYAVDRLGIEKLTAGAYAENVGSVRAFERAGFRREGRLRSQAVVDAEGHRDDVIRLGATRCEIISPE